MSKREIRFFVLHLGERDYRPGPEVHYEIQLLDSQGRAKASGYIGDTETELVIGDHRVPNQVLEAARRQPLGKGDYVDEEGKSIRPF